MSNLTLKTGRLLAVFCFALIFFSTGFSQSTEIKLKEKAIKFLKDFEPKLDEPVNDVQQSKVDQLKADLDRLTLLSRLAPAAYYAGETEKAENYSQKLLAAGQKVEPVLYSGQGINGYAAHVGNIVLGRIAFDNGEIEKAKEFLLAAGNVKANPSLKSFGPNMFLAKQLIEKGEHETVLKYFELCGAFWTSDRGRLDKWKTAVQNGAMPNFGVSLYTSLTNFQVVDKNQ